MRVRGHAQRSQQSHIFLRVRAHILAIAMRRVHKTRCAPRSAQIYGARYAGRQERAAAVRSGSTSASYFIVYVCVNGCRELRIAKVRACTLVAMGRARFGGPPVATVLPRHPCVAGTRHADASQTTAYLYTFVADGQSAPPTAKHQHTKKKHTHRDSQMLWKFHHDTASARAHSDHALFLCRVHSPLAVAECEMRTLVCSRQCARVTTCGAYNKYIYLD